MINSSRRKLWSESPHTSQSCKAIDTDPQRHNKYIRDKLEIPGWIWRKEKPINITDDWIIRVGMTEYGRKKPKKFILFIVLVTLYLGVEIDLYGPFLAPFGNYASKELFEYDRYCNFESGEQLRSAIDGLQYLKEKEVKMVYIADHYAQWSTLLFCHPNINQILIEYQLDGTEVDNITETLILNDFKYQEDCQEKFGDFALYYRIENKNEQTLVAINPIDKRLIITCFHYNIANMKSDNAYIVFTRPFSTPTYFYNISSLEDVSRFIRTVNNTGPIWKTQDLEP